MLKKKTEKQLKNLGLNSYEVKIWAALLSNGNATAGQLSSLANIPRSRSYDVLVSLEKKGFVELIKDKTIRYKPISPREAIEKVKNGIEKNTKGQIKSLNKFKDSNISIELHKAYNNKKSENIYFAATIRGRQNVHNHMEQMFKKAAQQILISTTQKEFVEFITNNKDLFEKLSRKNIKIKIFTKVTPNTKKQAETLKNFAEVVDTDDKSRFCIIDGKEIIFMIYDDAEVHEAFDVGIWTISPFAKDMEHTFLDNKKYNFSPQPL